MDERTVGLILRTRPLTESSLIVHWLTADFGRMATVAKGARRPKSPFRGKLDLFYLGEFTFQRSRRGELHNLREVALKEIHEALRHNLIALQQAAYFACLLEKTTETETPLPELYELTLQALQTLTTCPPTVWPVFKFELCLLRELGLSPDLRKTGLSSEAEAVLRFLADSNWSTSPGWSENLASAKPINNFLQVFLNHHLGPIPWRARETALATVLK